jgi:hypothetical protein
LLDELCSGADPDANGDGVSDAIDAALVLQVVAGLLDQLPDIDRVDGGWPLTRRIESWLREGEARW